MSSAEPSTAASTGAISAARASTGRASTRERVDRERVDRDGADSDSAERARRALEAVRALARASRVLERASGELSLAHYRVLSAIASGDERASRVAARLAVGKPTISAAVESLCQRGLLVRSEVTGDQRAAALRLTAEGEALLDRVEAEMVRQHRRPVRPDARRGGSCWSRSVWLGAAIDDVVADRHRASSNGREHRDDEV